MKTMSCIIIDDEPLAVSLLESFVRKTPDLTLAASFTDPVEAIAVLKTQPTHLVFLDIQMPDMDGMEVAHLIPASTRIIFTTAFKEYAFDSYGVNALDFLLKPIRYSHFIAAIEKARQWFNLQPTPPIHTLFIRVDGELKQIALERLLYVGAMKDYVMFYLEDAPRPLITHLTMKAVEEMLPTEKFLRVHRSYIVALEKIRSIDRNDCLYIGQEIIRVTEAYKENFNRYLQGKLPGNR